MGVHIEVSQAHLHPENEVHYDEGNSGYRYCVVSSVAKKGFVMTSRFICINQQQLL
jgi:hypothetical protein